MHKIRSNTFLFLMMCVVLSGCRQSRVSNTDTKDPISEPNSVPDREAWNASILISTSGRLKAVIEYGHMAFYSHNKVNYFDHGIVVDMFDEAGKHTTKLTAEKGKYHESTQDIWAIGHVKVVSDTGITLFTPVGRWDQNLQKIISDTTVMVTTAENDTIYGTGFQSNADFSHLVIDNPRGTRDKGLDFNALEREVNAPVPKGTENP